MIRLLLTSGRGPAECRIALAKVAQALTSEADAVGIDWDFVGGKDPDGLGPGSGLLVLHGEAADTFARGWVGSILWTSPSPVRPHHKRKNWFVGIVKLGAAPEVRQTVSEGDVRIETMRAGGPGGQHQNKTESAVRAIHLPTGLTVTVRQERSQARNRAVAIERLGALLRAKGELDALADRQSTQAEHDRLERGRPVRRFLGPGFRPA